MKTTLNVGEIGLRSQGFSRMRKSTVEPYMGGLEAISHRDVDLIVLNTAPPGIAWAAMKGQVLVNKDPRLHMELMLQKSAEAEDFRESVMDFLRLRESWRDANARSDT